MDKRYQVFVSSTYRDLKVERMEVMAALLELDCIPCGMEYFPAADETQWNFIQRLIDQCDYYVVIVGGKNGSLAPDGVSYTRKEYEYALSRNTPTLAFTHSNPQKLPEEHRESDPEGQRKLEDFVKLVKGQLCKEWKNADHLAGVVTRSLNKLIKERPRAGWVRGTLNSSSGNRLRISQKFGSTYWAAHDLLWTVSRLLGGGSRERILEGLVGSKHHLREVKYVHASLGLRLDRIYDSAQKLSEADWTPERRHAVSREVELLARELGEAIAAKQEKFKTHPSRK